MQRRKKKRRLKPAFKLAAVGIVLLGFGLILTGLLKTEKPQELPVFVPNAPSVLEVSPVAAPTLAPFSYTPNEDDVEGLAQMLWGEARGIPSDMEKAACVWCVLNRVDDESGVWPTERAGGLTPNKAKEITYSIMGEAAENYDGEWGDIPLAYSKTQGPAVAAQLDTQIQKAATDANNDAVVAVMKEVRALLLKMEATQ